MEVFKFNIEKAVQEIAFNTNKEFAEILGINPAARLTCTKPSGTASSLLGCSSGVHAWHSEYYIRRIRINKNEPIYTYLSIYLPEFLEDEYFKPNETAVLSIPIKAPEGAITRKESAIQLLERVKAVYNRWIVPGHNRGYNTNNVSATISIKENEWDEVRDWVWKNRNYYTGLSFLPYSDHSYIQAPFEDCTKETYEKMIELLSTRNINLKDVVEIKDNTNFTAEAACGGNGCEIQ